MCYTIAVARTASGKDRLVTVSVSVERQFKEQLEQVAQDEGRTTSNLCRLLLEEQLPIYRDKRKKRA